MNETSTVASDNPFSDLGFSPEKAVILQMRASRMTALRDFIEREKLTQVEAAARLGISQLRVSDLVRGKGDELSLETLIILSTRAGMRFTLQQAA